MTRDDCPTPATDPTLEAVAEGERRALREWQVEHPEPCDECEWETYDLGTLGRAPLRTMRRIASFCPKHGGR